MPLLFLLVREKYIAYYGEWVSSEMSDGSPYRRIRYLFSSVFQ